MTKRWLGVGLGVAAVVLWSSVATSASAQAPRTVVWLEHGALGARTERERALQLELEARDMVLLAASPPALPPGTPRPSAFRTASLVLARSGAAAVVWLEADSEGPPVSWLFARVRGDVDVVKAPLPHPPDVIDPQLLAIAAASLLEQLLSEKAVSAPTPPPAPPPAPPVPTPQQVAAIAPLSPAEIRPAKPAPQPLPPAPPRTYFVQLGFALTLADLHTGMETSSKPSLDEVFNEQRIAVDPADPSTVYEPRYFFDDSISYVADADSFDDYEDLDQGIPRGVTQLSTQCEADGVVTAAGELPSKFCARVDDPGLVPLPAIRLAFGMWLLPRLAISIVYQWHFTIEPERFLGAQTLGIEAQYLFAGRRERGLGVLSVVGFSVGREETPVVPHKYGDTVNALAGPLGLSLGCAVRYAFSPTLALVTTPSGGVRFPAGQLIAELTLATELSF